jgi:hypothetical protein
LLEDVARNSKKEIETLEDMIRKQDRQIALLEGILRLLESKTDDGR